MYPENYRYTKEHEWVHVENGVGTIGITDHAQSELGDIVGSGFATPDPLNTLRQVPPSLNHSSFALRQVPPSL